MTIFVFSRRMPAWSALAVSAVGSLLAAPAISQSSDKALAPVTVTASRFASDPAFAPIGASVITSEQIREAGIGNVNEAIRKIGGVYGRASTTGTQDYALDLRGFGTNSSQNMVILVDGIRLSENELSSALLTSIPIESVERIEIVRGGSSVLYGEGATAGTIQVITKRSGADKFRGTALVELGSFDHRELRTSIAQGWGGFSVDANASTQRSDNYRDNNAVKQNNFSGGMQWASNEGRIGMRVDAARQDSRLAGSLTETQYRSNPRQTTSPNDFGSYDTDRYTVFAERRFGEFELAAELSHREKTSKLSFGSAFGTFNSQANSDTTQFSPRVRHVVDSAGWTNELVAGLDFIKWDRKTASSFAGFANPVSDVSQESRAIYIRDEVRFGQSRIALGGRHEKFDKEAKGAATSTYTRSRSLNAWELLGSYAVTDSIDVFAKTGRSYRVANADENAFTPVLNTPLEPQTSRDLEIGGSIGNSGHKISARVFQHRIRNEIFYNPTAGFFGANVNLDPTKREGIEIEADARLASTLNVTAILQHVKAKFTSGPNANREMVLVPRNTATIRLNWLPSLNHSANLGVQWVDSQRYGGDFSNSCDTRIPSFTTVDGRYAVKAGAWEFAVSGSNLTDRRYFTNAFGACRNGIYPDPGRQIKISARMDF